METISGVDVTEKETVDMQKNYTFSEKSYNDAFQKISDSHIDAQLVILHYLFIMDNEKEPEKTVVLSSKTEKVGNVLKKLGDNVTNELPIAAYAHEHGHQLACAAGGGGKKR